MFTLLPGGAWLFKGQQALSAIAEIHLPVHARVRVHHFLLGQQLVGGGELLQLCREVIGALCHRRVLDGAVGEGHTVVGRFVGAFPAAAADLAEGSAELLRHGVVYDRVDGAVEVDADAAEKQEPAVQVGSIQEGVDHHQGAVGHPQHGEQDHHHSQHLGHLWRVETRERCFCHWACKIDPISLSTATVRC